MTEAEWLTCVDPWTMLRFLRTDRNDRKLRLLLCAFCRQSWALFEEIAGAQAFVELAERMANGFVAKKEVRAVRLGCLHALVDGMDWKDDDADFMLDRFGGFHFEDDPAWVREMAVRLIAVRALGQTVSANEVAQVVRALADARVGATDSQDCDLIREVFGNPFRPVTFDSSWLTSTVRALATGVYTERAFDRLPILADAIQDAGCDSDDVLTHLRSDGPHVKGCWALDLVLGKA
ncbi:hypothetical protein VT84_26050 [Gemmata sp. SH-PL17]|uniref:hypothetical protein n=1 Tax=Gemmata sp. SH-PL17 TaxID=1630693 RepID=UPI00078B4FE7|nr:hypothetical protein [Gemmata sp. SH-PL17]AMV27893.1 hypothetical protein VT84_26050 [Gemmata sp. SH-PL17]